MNTFNHARRIGLIGLGRIGRPVAQALEAGELPGWQLAAVLTKHGAPVAAHPLASADARAFFDTPLDLIIECAGPEALAAHGERALAGCEVWTVSAVALADAALLARIEAVAQRTGHRLRVLPGAIAGLDGVAAAAVDPDSQLTLDIDLTPGPGAPGLVFEGSVREAAARFPHHVNVAMAAALAGPGPDATRIRVHHPGEGPAFSLAVSADSRFGRLQARVQPRVAPGVHPVAASIVAALAQANRRVWVG